MYSNACSLPSKIHEFQATVYQNMPSFIFITETWLHSNIPDSVILPQDYTIYRDDRENRGGGGVCIIIKNHIENEQVTVCPITHNIPKTINAIFLKVKVGSQKFTLGCIYRPKVEYQDNRELIAALEYMFQNYNNCIIFGDFNYPEINWKNLSLVRFSQMADEFLDGYRGWNCKQMITKETRIRGEQSSLIDLLFCTDKKLINEITYDPPLGKSDHAVIMSKLQIQLKASRTKKILKRNFYKADYHKINNYITSKLTENNEQEASVIDIERIMTESFQNHIPLRSTRKNHEKPWINRCHFKEIDTKRHLWDKYRTTKLEADYLIYRQQNNKLKALILKARSQYEESLLEKEEKSFYKYIKRTLSSHVSDIQLKDPNTGNLVTDPALVAEVLAERFQTVYTLETMERFPFLPDKLRRVEEFSSINITEDLVVEAINNMKMDASPGPDNIPVIFIKNCLPSIQKYLSAAFNNTIVNGIIPESWLTAHVIPIYKKGSKLEPLNYRPISLTCSLSKILEKILTKALINFVLTNKIITQDQHGFLPGRSTATNLLSCLNEWTQMMDNGQPIDILYLDYEKAFDKVPHKRLMYKLDHFVGIRGQILSFIEKTHSSRTFRVRVQGHLSNAKPVHSGVVQGSVLGPILFTCYIADLSRNLETASQSFADDRKVYCNPLTDLDKFIADLRTLEVWTQDWLMKLNTNKCTILHVGRNNPQNKYSINNTEIQQVTVQRDLGVIITENLKWETHIAQMVKKANTLIYLTGKAFSNKSVEFIRKIYISFIRPKLEYCHTIWNPYFVKDIELLERSQRRCTKIPTAVKDIPYEERLKLFNLPTLKDRRERGDLIETFKILHGSYDEALKVAFTVPSTNVTRGHSKKIQTERCNLLQRKHFLTNRVVNSWNALPDSVVSAENKNIFKNRLDQHKKSTTNYVTYM